MDTNELFAILVLIFIISGAILSIIGLLFIFINLSIGVPTWAIIVLVIGLLLLLMGIIFYLVRRKENVYVVLD